MTVADGAQLVIALVALWVAVVAIRRDRPDMRARFVDAAMGTLVLAVVNVGLRPVRIERIVRREGWWPRRHDREWPRARGSSFTELPTVVQPGDEIVVAIANEGFLAGHGTWQPIDAAGRRYAIQRRAGRAAATDGQGDS